MSEKLGYRGYVSSRGFGGYRIPVPVQSLVLRDYCERSGLLYVLPVNENIFPNSYMVLEGMIRDLSIYQGIVMCSMHMLPQRPERRQKIYDTILSQGAAIHMVIEGLLLTEDADIAKIEDLILFSQIAQAAPVTVPLSE